MRVVVQKRSSWDHLHPSPARCSGLEMRKSLVSVVDIMGLTCDTVALHVSHD